MWVLSILFALLLLASPVGATSSTFDGSTSRVAIDDADTQLSVFSTGCWAYRTGAGENNEGRILFNAAGWELFNREVTANGRFTALGWDGVDGVWATTSLALPLNEWHFVAVTYNTGATTNDPVVYVDATTPALSEIMPTGSYADASTTFFIGDNSGATRSWAGSLANCFLYNRILTANEITQVRLFGPQTLRNGLIGYWPLGEFGGNNYTSTSGLTGTETGITTSTTGPPVSVPQGGGLE